MEPSTPMEWECCACNEVFKDYTAISIDSIENENICATCVKEMFNAALDTEQNYPPKWGSLILHPKHFSHIVDAAFIARYEELEKEYKTPPRARMYCTCGKFMGPACPESNWSFVFSMILKCSECTALKCMKCAASTPMAEVALSHDCGQEIEKLHADERQAFEGLERGVHYQNCPSEACKRRVELREACNHVTCLCGTQFCFVCGVEAKGGSGHWGTPGCPRYGLRSNLNRERVHQL